MRFALLPDKICFTIALYHIGRSKCRKSMEYPLREIRPALAFQCLFPCLGLFVGYGRGDPISSDGATKGRSQLEVSESSRFDDIITLGLSSRAPCPRRGQRAGNRPSYGPSAIRRGRIRRVQGHRQNTARHAACQLRPAQRQRGSPLLEARRPVAWS